MEEDPCLDEFYKLFNKEDFKNAEYNLLSIYKSSEGVLKLGVIKIIAYIIMVKKDYLRALEYLQAGLNYIYNSDIYEPTELEREFYMQ